MLEQDGAVRVSVSAGSSHFALILPIVCAPAQRATLALAVCEINLRLPLGSFRLDPSSGKLSFCVDEVDDGALEPSRHARRLVTCVRSVETHWPRLLRAWDEQGRTIADAAVQLRGHRLAGAHPAPASSAAHAGDVRAWLQNPRTNVAQAILSRNADTGAWFVKPVVHGCIVEEHEVDAVEWLARCTDELALAWCCDYPNPETQRSLEGLGFQGERLELLVERSLLAPLPPVPRGLSRDRPAQPWPKRT